MTIKGNIRAITTTLLSPTSPLSRFPISVSLQTIHHNQAELTIALTKNNQDLALVVERPSRRNVSRGYSKFECLSATKLSAGSPSVSHQSVDRSVVLSVSKTLRSTHTMGLVPATIPCKSHRVN